MMAMPRLLPRGLLLLVPSAIPGDRRGFEPPEPQLHRCALETTPGAVYGGKTGQVVSALVATSRVVRVDPARQGTHAWLCTCWFSAHWVALHDVSGPLASSPGARVDPAGQSAHA